MLSLPVQSSLVLEREHGEPAGTSLVTDQNSIAWEQRLQSASHFTLSYSYRFDRDHTVKDADRDRFIASVLYEHKYVNAYYSYLKTTDQASAKVVPTEGDGYSLWITPKTTFGLEGLFRYDHLNPTDVNDSHKDRVIGGVAYWPKMAVPSVSTALMLDWEQVKYQDFAPSRPTENRIAVHTLVTF